LTVVISNSVLITVGLWRIFLLMMRFWMVGRFGMMVHRFWFMVDRFWCINWLWFVIHWLWFVIHWLWFVVCRFGCIHRFRFGVDWFGSVYWSRLMIDRSRSMVCRRWVGCRERSMNSMMRSVDSNAMTRSRETMTDVCMVHLVSN